MFLRSCLDFAIYSCFYSRYVLSLSLYIVTNICLRKSHWGLPLVCPPASSCPDHGALGVAGIMAQPCPAPWGLSFTVLTEAAFTEVKAIWDSFLPICSHLRVPLFSPQLLSIRGWRLTSCQPTNMPRSPSSESGNSVLTLPHRAPGELTSFSEKLFLRPLTSCTPDEPQQPLSPQPWTLTSLTSIQFCQLLPLHQGTQSCDFSFQQVVSTVVHIDLQTLKWPCTLGGNPTRS